MAGRSDLPPLRVYASGEAHSSVEKACIALGLGQDGLCKIEVDDDLRMRPSALAAAIGQDVAAGVRPIAVVPTVGTTSTTSVDPVPEIADIAAEHGIWMHVDAAYGGAAGLLPDRRALLAGCERADSLVFNPHKWLLTPVDCSLLYTARPEALRAAFSLVPFYLTSSEEDVVNLMDYGLVLGRRFRALKLWFVLRAYGREGLARIIAGHVELARQLAGWVDAAPGWQRLAPVPQNQRMRRTMHADCGFCWHSAVLTTPGYRLSGSSSAMSAKGSERAKRDSYLWRAGTWRMSGELVGETRFLSPAIQQRSESSDRRLTSSVGWYSPLGRRRWERKTRLLTASRGRPRSA
jgi:glutamate/tyrosine decarboxylase-like PLP-dependent enzyme